jgi:hypothetical protein
MDPIRFLEFKPDKSGRTTEFEGCGMTFTCTGRRAGVVPIPTGSSSYAWRLGHGADSATNVKRTPAFISIVLDFMPKPSAATSAIKYAVVVTTLSPEGVEFEEASTCTAARIAVKPMPGWKLTDIRLWAESVEDVYIHSGYVIGDIWFRYV